MNLLMVIFCCLTFEKLAWSIENEKGAVNTACASILCSCCIEDATCIIEQDGVCFGQCKVGYFGGKCKNNCPDKCVACQDSYNPTNDPSLHGVANCTQCKSGFYSTPEFYQCQFKCSTACQTCTSDTTCEYCKDGYNLSGKVCIKCPTGCTTCTSETLCSTCRTGYYLSTGICYPCPTVCSSCKSIDHCLSCQRGFHLSDGVCSSCPEPCTSCTSLSQCTECKDGYYVSEAGIGVRNCRRCSIGCVSGQCNKTSGICPCKDTFTRDKCDKCVDGRFGEDCLNYCPKNCRFDNCDKITGACLGGCFADFSGDQCCLEGPGCKTCSSEYVCVECVPGKHGPTCEKVCPEDCENNVCYKDTGACRAVRESRKSNNNAAVIGGGVAGAIAVIVIVAVVVILYRRRTTLAECAPSSEDIPGQQQPKHKDGQLEGSNNQSNQIVTVTTYQNPSFQNLGSPDTDDNMYAELQDEGSRA